MLNFDFAVMTVVAIVCLPIFFTDHFVARWEGGLLLGYYVAYLVYLVLNATQHEALPVFNAAMVLFILPLTALALVVFAAQALHSYHKDGDTRGKLRFEMMSLSPYSSADLKTNPRRSRMRTRAA